MRVPPLLIRTTWRTVRSPRSGRFSAGALATCGAAIQLRDQPSASVGAAPRASTRTAPITPVRIRILPQRSPPVVGDRRASLSGADDALNIEW